MLSKIGAAAAFISVGAIGMLAIVGAAFGLITVDERVSAVAAGLMPELETIERVRQVMPLGWVLTFVVLIYFRNSIARLLDSFTDKVAAPGFEALGRLIPQAPKPDPVTKLREQAGASPRRVKEEVGDDRSHA